MNGFIFDEIPPKNFIFQLLVPFFVTLTFLQGFRTYVVNLYISFFNILWEGTGNYTPLITLLVFGSPLLALLLYRKIPLNHMIVGSSILTMICAIPISLQLAYDFELIFSSLVVAFYVIFLQFYLIKRRQVQSSIGNSAEAALLGVSFILAFSYDILIRAFGTTYDLSRTLLYFPLQLIFTIALLGLIVWKQRQTSNPPEVAQNNSTEEPLKLPLISRLAGVLTIAGIGAFLFLEHSLIISPHNRLRWAFPPYFLLDITIAFFLILGILAIVSIILLHKRGRALFDQEKWYTMALSSLIIIMLFTGFWYIPLWFDVLSLLIINILLLINFYYILQFTLHPKLRWSVNVLCTAIFVAIIFFLVWDFMLAFSFTYAYLGDIGTIFAGQYMTIMLSAVIILGIASTYSTFKLRRLSN
ncbi:MAG: hypothetical protein ACFE8O_12645 [Candidatus Hermodarchaeota archaeon]